MSANRNAASKDDAGEENPWPWIAILVVVIGWGAWVNRNSWYAKLAPYGLTTEDTRTGYGGGHGGGAYGGDPFGQGSSAAGVGYGTGHFHINLMGWFAIVVLAAGVVAGLWCVLAAVNVSRWHAERGTRAIPKIPVSAAAIVVAAAVFVAVLMLIGRQSNPGARGLVFVGGAGLAVGAWFVVMIYASMPAHYWRLTQAFAGRAEQVLGHGHPGAGRVKAAQWKVEIVGDGSRRWPATLVAAAGPGWQHKPSELDELNRYAREFGWPPYEWRYDPMCKSVTGTARPDVETLFG
ncbi:hypothetical protein MKCMC460_62960 (plasmid) [Mycobacterium sp. 20KCMC460]|uniref:hypothetical protein n=1 Tax=Mycobacterium TaxID=1763 RepID=UPI001EE23E57|nr:MULTISPECIES: hypothetical protein [Mycobacterium]BDE17436.1 hypothetical protein MKCMC460_62960 [Mycobacterium sp. 20KCMC460]GLC23047.1 hypothetical protein SRL2020472_56180 [Mycobacterium kiyosense]